MFASAFVAISGKIKTLESKELNRMNRFPKKAYATAAFFLLATVVFATGLNWQQEKTKQDAGNTPVYMRAKLASSKLVLEGLVTEDFSKIKAGADEMNRFSRVEHWPSSDDAVYQFFSKTFRDQCKKLSRLAEAKNLEGSHYTYVHMTTTCVECHNYVRGNFKIAPNKKSPKGPVRLIPTYWDKEK
jgi:hypothetical protein